MKSEFGYFRNFHWFKAQLHFESVDFVFIDNYRVFESLVGFLGGNLDSVG